MFENYSTFVLNRDVLRFGRLVPHVEPEKSGSPIIAYISNPFVL